MKPHDQIQKTALTVTRWVGSPASIIVHTILFAGSFFAVFTGWLHFDRMLLILTTIVSLEAIYLAIFIQMTINFTTQELAEVSEDIEEMQEDIGEIAEDVDELQEDVEEISEDVEEMTEEEASEEVLEEQRKTEQKNTLVTIQADLRKLMNDISKLQQPKQ
ncbi:MAG: hypothetical protein Q7R90_02575 [bacterium]|nr:hypothetical protein [bacterium]